MHWYLNLGDWCAIGDSGKLVKVDFVHGMEFVLVSFLWLSLPHPLLHSDHCRCHEEHQEDGDGDAGQDNHGHVRTGRIAAHAVKVHLPPPWLMLDTGFSENIILTMPVFWECVTGTRERQNGNIEMQPGWRKLERKGAFLLNWKRGRGRSR